MCPLPRGTADGALATAGGGVAGAGGVGSGGLTSGGRAGVLAVSGGFGSGAGRVLTPAPGRRGGLRFTKSEPIGFFAGALFGSAGEGAWPDSRTPVMGGTGAAGRTTRGADTGVGVGSGASETGSL